MNEASDESEDQAADRPQPDEQDGAQPSEAELRKILEAHEAWLEGKATGQRADLSGANLSRAKLQKANLQSANLEGAKLGDADLRNANLSGADLSSAKLHRTDFRGATLQDANLTDVSGLLGEQLAGLDVSGAKLPDDIAAFDGLNHVTELSQTSRTTFLALIGACVFSWITVGATTDVELVTNAGSSPLPVLQTEVPIVWFFWAAPMALFSLYVYLHLYLQPLWHGLASLPAIFPDGRTLDQRAYPWLLSGLVRAHVRLLKPARPPLSHLQNFVSIVFAWWIVPLTLFLFWLRYLPKHDWGGTGFHIAILAMSFGFGLLTYLSARAMLQGDNPNPFRLKAWWSDPRFYQGASVLVTGVVLGFVSFASINGEWALKCKFLGVRAWVPAAFQCIGYDVFANLEKAEISKPPPNWKGKKDDRLDLVEGRQLLGVNLRFAKGSGANFVNANLAGANLQHAKLSGADFREAALVDANLQGALLAFADLRNAKLRKADLRKADLRFADLRKAKLLNTDVREANLRQANLSEAKLWNADLREANLRRANLREANLLRAKLGNADLRGADLQEAKLWNADLRGADLKEAKLVSADLRGANLTGARNLSQQQLDRACGDQTTKLPPNLTIPTCLNKSE